ncbi:hypothetical protein [Sphingomonas faeni]|uniref:hypothetical protein n=1 Tax=Sphingomonas faeni TaxID=185950 RepID=UPI0027822CED|nr:hypothetical protein [Sphingomonas faeni]MDQ0838117.1 hypothetical protein [Sphingomonas faeni]
MLLVTLSASGGGKRPVPTIARPSHVSPSIGATAPVMPMLHGNTRRNEDDTAAAPTTGEGAKTRKGAIPAPGLSN